MVSDELAAAGESHQCDAYVYTLAHQDGSTDISGFLSVDSNGLITLETNDPSLASSNAIPVVMTVGFNDLSESAGITLTKQFNVFIDPCVLISIDENQALATPQVFTIGNS